MREGRCWKERYNGRQMAQQENMTSSTKSSYISQADKLGNVLITYTLNRKEGRKEIMDERKIIIRC